MTVFVMAEVDPSVAAAIRGGGLAAAALGVPAAAIAGIGRPAAASSGIGYGPNTDPLVVSTTMREPARRYRPSGDSDVSRPETGAGDGQRICPAGAIAPSARDRRGSGPRRRRHA